MVFPPRFKDLVACSRRGSVSPRGRLSSHQRDRPLSNTTHLVTLPIYFQGKAFLLVGEGSTTLPVLLICLSMFPSALSLAHSPLHSLALDHCTAKVLSCGTVISLACRSPLSVFCLQSMLKKLHLLPSSLSVLIKDLC